MRHLIVCLAFILMARLGLTQSEHSIKAAFLANFVRYIDWPSSALGAGDPLVIGIIGKDPFGKQIDDLAAAKSSPTRKIQVRRINWAQIKECNLLFIPAAESGNYDSLSAIRNLPIVTVGETDGFAAKYGHIGFRVENSRITFEINAVAAKGAGLNISSRLLQLATVVKKG